MDDISKINKQLEAAVAALGQFALSAEATKAAISALQGVIAQPKLPKLPEGYNPHRPGDPCPINPETWCAVAYRDGTTSETEFSGTEAVSSLAKNWPWDVTYNGGCGSEIIGYKIVPSPEQPKEEPKPEWPWKPEERQEYYASRANHAGDVAYFAWSNDGVDKRLFALGDVYRTCEEAQARAELNKRLAMTARLRQLGGGDEGGYAVRWDADEREWIEWATCVFAPGEARFLDKSSAKAAIETLRAANLLPESWQ